MMPNLQQIVEVYETNSYKTANEKLVQGWILLHIGEWASIESNHAGSFQTSEVAYVLGRTVSGEAQS